MGENRITNNRLKLYNALSPYVSNIGTFEEFNTRMDNKKNRQKVYEVARRRISNAGTFEEFNSRIYEAPQAGSMPGWDIPPVMKDGKFVPPEERGTNERIAGYVANIVNGGKNVNAAAPVSETSEAGVSQPAATVASEKAEESEISVASGAEAAVRKGWQPSAVQKNLMESAFAGVNTTLEDNIDRADRQARVNRELLHRPDKAIEEKVYNPESKRIETKYISADGKEYADKLSADKSTRELYRKPAVKPDFLVSEDLRKMAADAPENFVENYNRYYRDHGDGLTPAQRIRRDEDLRKSVDRDFANGESKIIIDNDKAPIALKYLKPYFDEGFNREDIKRMIEDNPENEKKIRSGVALPELEEKYGAREKRKAETAASIESVSNLLDEIRSSGSKQAKSVITDGGRELSDYITERINKEWYDAWSNANAQMQTNNDYVSAAPWDEAAGLTLSKRNDMVKAEEMDVDKMVQKVLSSIPEDVMTALIGQEISKVLKYDREFDVNRIGEIQEYVIDKFCNEIAEKTWEHATNQERKSLKDVPSFLMTLKKAVDSTVPHQILQWAVNTKGSGMKPQYQAEAEWDEKHPVWSAAGFAVGMAMDAPTYAGSFAGGAATKGLTNIASREAAKQVTKAGAATASREIGLRAIESGLTKGVVSRGTVRGASAMTNGAVNFGVYTALKNPVEQLAQTGEFDLGEYCKAVGHGLTAGGVTGLAGNTVRVGTSKAAGKVSDGIGKAAVAMGGKAAGFLGEVSSFAAVDAILLGEDFDKSWNSALAMVTGMKLSHLPKKIAEHGIELPTQFKRLTPEERRVYKSRWDKALSRFKDHPETEFTESERQMLRDYGYDDIAGLTAETLREKDVILREVSTEEGDSWIEEYREYDRKMEDYERMLQDVRLPETLRAKWAFVLTGEKLPLSAITSVSDITKGDNGKYYVSGHGAKGEIIRNEYDNEDSARRGKEEMEHQAELNVINIGERYRDGAVDDEMRAPVFAEALEKEMKSAGFESMEDLRRAMVSGSEADRQKAEAVYTTAVHSSVEHRYDAMTEAKFSKSRPDGIAAEIEERTGIDINDAIRKNAGERSAEERYAVDSYIKKLYGKEDERLGADKQIQAARQGATQAYESGKLLYGRYEDGGDGAGRVEAEAEMAGVGERYREALEVFDDAFGAEAEMRMAQMEEDAWGLLGSGELTYDQQDAVLGVINARAAMEGIEAAADESAEGKRKAISEAVNGRTHRQSGMIQPATMKVDDRQVYVVSGDVVMFEDGTGVDARSSSDDIIVMDKESGKLEFTSADRILRVDEAVDPQVELDAAMAEVDAGRQRVSDMTQPEAKDGGVMLDNEENSVTSHVNDIDNGNRFEQGDDGISGNDGGSMVGDTASGLAADRDRSDIRVYEDGVASQPDEYSGYSERDRREAESERLVGIAKANGQYIEPTSHTELGRKRTKASGESAVYDNHEHDGRVYKVKNPYAKSPMKGGVQPEDAILEHHLHNRYFPETAYRFEGISDDAGDVRIVLSQDYVESVGQPTKAQIEAALAEKGLYPEGKYTYGNEEVSVTDVTGDNALLGADGKVYFIDPIINVKKPVREILGDAGKENAVDGTVSEVSEKSNGAEELSPLQRLPVDETGEPVFEQAESAEHGWDALVEYSEGDVDAAKEVADVMVEEKRKALEKAQKLKTKGRTPSEILASRKANAAEVAKAQAEFEHWQNMAAVEQIRQDALHAQERAEAEEAARAEQQWQEDKRKLDKRLRETAEEVRDVPEAVAVLENMDPQSIDEVAAYVLSTNRVLWGAKKRGGAVVSQGAAGHTGFGEGERRKLFGLFASEEKGGVSIERLAEDVFEEACQMFKVNYDNLEARDALIDMISGAHTMGDIRNYIADRRMEQARKIAEDYREYYAQADEDYHQENYHMGAREYRDYEEQMMERMKDCAQDFDERDFYSNIADEIINRQREEDEYRRVHGIAGAGADARDGGGDEVLSPQRTAERGRGEAVAEQGAGRGAGDRAAQRDTAGEIPAGARNGGRNADVRGRNSDEETNGRLEEVAPSVGPFGEIYTQFKGKPQEAVTFLLAKRSGEAIGALYHKAIGDIDLVWGKEGTAHSDGYGLAKLAKYHPEVLFNLQEVLNDMVVTKRSANRVQLESDKYQAAVRLTWDDKKKTWLLTMFEKKNSVPDNTTDTVETLSSNGNDTATPENTVISSDVRSVPAVGEGTNTDTSEVNSGHSEGATAPAGNSSKTSDDKDNTLLSDKQASASESSVQQSDNVAMPTEAQKRAGNYRMEHRRVDGYDISIENKKGSIRRGKDANGTEWESEMHNDYGYIRGTEGVDGDHIDVFLSDTPEQGDVFVVDQYNPDGSFDEHKVMYGFADGKAALDAYLANYEQGWEQTRRLDVTGVSKDEFKKWIQSSKRKTKPFAEYVNVKKEVSVKSEEVKDYTDRLIGWDEPGPKENPFLKVGAENSQDDALPKLHQGSGAKRNDEVYKVAKGLVEAAGVPVHEVSGAEAEAMFNREADRYENKKTPVADQPNRVNEKLTSGSVLTAHSGGSSSNATDSRKHDAKIVNDTQSAKSKIKKYNNGDFSIDYSSLDKAFGSLGSLLSMRSNGGSRYVVLRTDKGDSVAIRLSDHGANGNNFKRDGADKNLSIVVERRKYDTPESGIEFTEAVIAHEVFKARGEEVVDAIVKGVESVLSDGEFTLPSDMGRVERKGKKVSELRARNGEVYGWTVGDEVYLNRDAMNPETPVHEYTHLWDRMVQRENPELWARGKELIKETPLWDEVVNDPNYADIRDDEDAVASEVHSRLTGKRGAEILDGMISEARKDGPIAEAEAVSLVTKLRRWLRDMFAGLKETFGKWSKKELRDLTAEQFADMTLRDLADGMNPKDEMRRGDQARVVTEANPMLDDYHRGVRGRDDVRTFDEVVSEAEKVWAEYGDLTYPDMDMEMLRRAKEEGVITVYSSKPIKAGVFVTPSRMNAEDYAGGGKVYEKQVRVDEVAWTGEDEGQYAPGTAGESQRASDAQGVRFHAGENNADTENGHKKSPSKGRLDLTTPPAIAEVTSSSLKGTAKLNKITENLTGLQEKLTGQTTHKGVLSELASAILANRQGYSTFVTANGNEVHVRISNHNANAENFAERGHTDGNISIVIKSRHTPNTFVVHPEIELTEYVYTKEAIKSDGGLLSQVAESLRRMIETGEYVDLSGKAIVNRSPEVGDGDSSLRSDHDGDDIRYRFIGEKGAENLDRTLEVTYRLDNLNVARKMESLSKTAKEIKIATGWERGNDGKWRYEEADGKLINPNVKSGIYKLPDVWDDVSLYKEYPSMEDCEVEFMHEPTNNYGGWYSVDNKIYINTARFHTASEVRSAFAHEIQHAIQFVEGFTFGGTQEDVIDLIYGDGLGNFSPSELYQLSSFRRMADNLIKNGKFKRLSNAVKAIIKESKVHNFYPFDTYDATISVYEALMNHSADQLEKAANHDRRDGYNRIAGEVEARNVQKRISYSDAARRHELSVDTEDIRREDQIFLQDGIQALLKLAENSEISEESAAVRGDEMSGEETDVEAMRGKAAELAGRLNLPVRIVTTAEEAAGLPTVRQRNSKGFYDEGADRRGETAITVVLPNHRNLADVVRTILHEGVWHKGIRLFCKSEAEFHNLLDHLYDNSSDGIRAEIDAEADAMYRRTLDGLKRRYGNGAIGEARAVSEAERMKREGKFRRDATEEFGASVTEEVKDGEFERMSEDRLGFFGRIVSFVEKAIEKILRGVKIRMPRKYTRGDWKMFSHLFYERLRRGETPEEFKARTGKEWNPVYAEAERVSVRYKEERDGYKRNTARSEAALEHLEPSSGGGRNVTGREARLNAITDPATNHTAKVIEKLGIAKAGLSQVAETYRNSANPRGFLSDLSRSLDLIVGSNGSGYRSFELQDGRTMTIRVSNHNANSERAKEDMVSIVIKRKHTPNVFVPSDNHVDEYVYFKEDIRKAPAGTLSSIAESISELLDTGEYIDRTGLARENHSPEREDIHFRDGDDMVAKTPVLARAMYDARVAGSAYQVREAMQDSMLGLKELYKAIEKASGRDVRIEDIAGSENAYLAENRMSSINQEEQKAYERLLIKPMLKAIAKIAPKEKLRAELMQYMMAKHGLERNALMRDKAKADGVDAANADATDYAGLTGLFETGDVADAENQAHDMVDNYEKTHDTTELWSAVNAATKASLSKLREGGLMSKSTYDNISGMYDYYIPLRGWAETTADEIYGYVSRNDGDLRGNVLKKAKGRTSVADDPIATIAMMGEQAIAQANRNRMKQHFFNYVRKNPSDLVSVNSLWLMKNDITGEWEPVFASNISADDDAATVSQKISDFETKMLNLSATEPDKYKRGRQARGIPYKLGKGVLGEHTVLVKSGDDTYVLTINGNPRAAQALNGLSNPDVGTGVGAAVFGLGEKWNRWIAPIYTTRNPEFMLSNFLRDAFYTNTSLWVKESPKYASRFNANFLRYNPGRMLKLFSRHEADKLDMSNPVEKQFKEFMANGGETGYTNQRTIERHKKALEKMLKRAGRKYSFGQVIDYLGEKWDMANSATENCARFAAYVTSREMGRSIERSIWDAKEVSVNFNKKGAGAKFKDATGQTYLGAIAGVSSGLGRGLYVFWNATVQASTNLFRNGSRHQAKMTALVASMIALGAVQAVLGAMDDDEDPNNYYNQPDYTRRSNIMFRIGDVFLSHPIPHEFLPAFGLGELAASLVLGKEEKSAGEIVLTMMEMMSEYSPLAADRAGLDHALMPSPVKPWYEAAVNESWTGMPIYRETPYNENMPEWTKAYKNTNRSLVNLAEAMNRYTGGDDYTKGFIDINPAQIEYVMNGYLGGPFKLFNKVSKLISSENEFAWRNVPFASVVVKEGDERTANRKITNDFFRYMNEYEEVKRRVRSYENDTLNVFKSAESLAELSRTPSFHRYWIINRYKDKINSIDKQFKEAVTPAELERAETERNELRKMIVGKIKGRRMLESSDTSGMARRQGHYLLNKNMEGTISPGYINSRIKTARTRELLHDYDIIESTKRKLSELKKNGRYDEYFEGMQSLRYENNLLLHNRIGRYKKDIKKMVEQLYETTVRSEAEELTRRMLDARERLLEDVAELEAQ